MLRKMCFYADSCVVEASSQRPEKDVSGIESALADDLKGQWQQQVMIVRLKVALMARFLSLSVKSGAVVMNATSTRTHRNKLDTNSSNNHKPQELSE